jgi:hypothetical protein
MTTRAWTGGTGRFGNPNAWTPGGNPVPGDDLDIVGGTATVSGGVLLKLSIQLGAPSGMSDSLPAVLRLHDSIIAANTTVTVGGTSPAPLGSGLGSATIEASGIDLNLGTIGVAGFTAAGGGFPTPSQLTIDIGTGRFENAGTLEAGNTPAKLVVHGQSAHAVLSNDGLIDAGSVVNLDVSVLGIGKIAFGAPYLTGPSPHAVTGPGVATTAAVGYGQTVDFRAASGVDSHGTLSIGDPHDFHALISNFVSGSRDQAFTPLLHQDLIALSLPEVTSATYRDDAGGGVLTLTGGGDTAQLRFAGSYTLGSFQITSGSGGTDIVVKPA